jgi:prepilin-type N-terminal cleavage/methylation domain-containing protein
MRKIMSKSTTGFTLIELLVVIAIISMLSSVVLSSLNSARSKGRDTARIMSMRETIKALEMYYLTYGVYPGINNGTQNGLGALVTNEYISSISSEIIYLPFEQGGGSILCEEDICQEYHIGITLENWNVVLSSDKDLGESPDPPGNSLYGDGSNCNNNSNPPDRCYDIYKE